MLDQPIIILNDDFRNILEQVTTSDEHFFITGRAGTGKSTLLNTLRQTFAKKFVVLAPTGVAALNVGGQTIHSFFRFPGRGFTLADIKQLRARGIYQNLDTIIIDEISMVRADLLDCIDYFMRVNGKHPDKPFGGVQMLFFGDLFQLPPVVSTPEEQEMFRTVYQSPYFFSAEVMRKMHLTTIELTQVFRQTDRRFLRLLEAVRTNSLDLETLAELNERYEPTHADGDDDDDGTPSIVLSARNATVNAINSRRINALDTPAVTFTGTFTGDFNENICPAEAILVLKEGAQVMFVRNDNSTGQYVNGTLGTVVSLTPDEIKVEITAKGKPPVRVKVEPVKWEAIRYDLLPSGELGTKVAGSFKQYPLKLAWAITIHKAQGKTFDEIVIDLGTGAFEHGQTYVALSRCRTLQGITLRQLLRPRDVMLDERVIDFYDSNR